VKIVVKIVPVPEPGESDAAENFSEVGGV